MSNQEPIDFHEATFGVDPAVEGSDRAVVHNYRYDINGNAISHEVSLPNRIPQEMMNRLRELADRFKARLSPESEQRTDVLFDDAPGRQYPPEFVEETVRQRIHRFNLYEGISAHGVSYGSKASKNGDRLICGMHPYGPDSEKGEDWEDDWLKTLKSPAWFSNLDFSDRELWLDRLKGLLADSDPEFLGYRIMNGLEHAGVINHVELKAFIQEVRAGN